MSGSVSPTWRRGRPSSSGRRALRGGVVIWVAAACAGSPGASELSIPADTLGAPVDTVRVALPPGRPVGREILGVKAAVERDSSWVVLDARAKRIAFLSPRGELVRVAGREGDGPGEMRVPVALAFLDDRVAVAERSGRLVFFDSSGAPAGLALVRDPACALSDVHGLIGGEDSLVALTWCTPRSGRMLARVARVGPDGGTRILAEWVYNDFGSGSVDPMRLPVLGSAAGALVVGVVPDPCLRILNGRGEAVRHLCYPDLPRRPVPDSIRESMGLLEKRLRSRGLDTEVRVPAELPAFRALVGGGDTWGFMALPPEGGEAVDWVENGRLHRIVVPEDGQVFLGRSSILLAVERAEGTSFVVLPLRGAERRDGPGP